MFLIFVAIAVIFWIIVSLNDSVTETFRVKVKIENVPDSVTFINDPPATIHVTMRDKGTNILRSGVIKNPEVLINFREYSHDGVLKMTYSDLISELKADFGGASQISSISLDSLRLYYTDSPGKRVPVAVQSELTPAPGYVISGSPTPLTKGVTIFSYGDEIDTVHRVRTQLLARRDLSQTSVFKVKLMPIRNVKIVPSEIDIKVNVEPLVHKEAYVSVEVINEPQNESVLLFPNKVPVSVYVPMSRFNDEQLDLSVFVDYKEIRQGRERVKVHVRRRSDKIVNVELKQDSVEYTIVRH